MAYLRKVKSGWRVEIERNGVRKSRTFETKAAAALWSGAEEAEILAVKHGAFPKKTFADALVRYRDEISPTKRGGDWEGKRIDAFIRDYPKLVAIPVNQVGSHDLVPWRDARLREVSKGSVQRDSNLFSHVFTIARDEWRWCADSPFRGFRTPGENPPRQRRITPHEIHRICRWLGHRTGRVPVTKQAQVALAFLISLRTGMRSGEILALKKERIDLAGRVARVPHKTEHITGRPREVPLSRHALRLLKPFHNGFAWTVDDASRDALFRKATKALLIDGLTFHDARADALTRFAKKVDVMQLARISGHKDLRILMEHYYRITPAEIAAKLD